MVQDSGSALIFLIIWFLGAGGAMREHKTSFHAVVSIVRKEGFLGVYNGYALPLYFYQPLIRQISSVTLVLF